MNAIEVEGLSKRYRLWREKRSIAKSLLGVGRRGRRWEDVWALRDVAFTVSQGETIGIIGRNGSGKTTLLKLLAGVTVPNAGRIHLHRSASALLELGTGFENELTGRENIYLSGTLLGLTHRQIRERFDRIVAFADLGPFIDSPIQTYSAGMWMRLGFAMAIHVDFEILLVDEVLAVGDLEFQERCVQRFRQLKTQGVTILVVSHNLQQINQVCNRALWLDGGQMRMYDRVDAVTTAYAGAVRTAPETIAQEPPLPWQRRWGSQDAVIMGFFCRDAEGRTPEAFRTGETIEIVIRYEARRRIERPVFGLGIHRVDGLHLCGPNSRAYGMEIAAIEGVGEVSFTMPSLTLLAGEYRLSAAIYDDQIQHPLDHHDQMYRLTVLPNAAVERYGLMKPWGTWQHRASVRQDEQVPTRV